jgi:hypothetical protein
VAEANAACWSARGLLVSAMRRKQIRYTDEKGVLLPMVFL